MQFLEGMLTVVEVLIVECLLNVYVEGCSPKSVNKKVYRSVYVLERMGIRSGSSSGQGFILGQQQSGTRSGSRGVPAFVSPSCQQSRIMIFSRCCFGAVWQVTYSLQAPWLQPIHIPVVLKSTKAKLRMWGDLMASL
eukprot:jgi/Botrbrau1/12643/Bobra.67_1s0009.1